MHRKARLGVSLLLGLLWLGSAAANATTFLQFQSTYLGDGWFQYQMNVLNDPFFTEADVTGFGVTFTNQIDQGSPPSGWTNVVGTANWEDTTNFPSRPYECTFLVRSSETSYRLSPGTNDDGAVVLLSLILAQDYPGVGSGSVYSVNVVGYAQMPCLVPCTPEEADGSPTNVVYDLKLLPDITISQLIQTNGEIYGLDFTWTNSSTFALQGGPDLRNWTNITYLWSYPPETVWTTNVPLNAYGSFFRLALVADGHSTNLPPLTSSLVLAPKAVTTATPATTTPQVTRCQFVQGKVIVNVATRSGQTVQVQAMDSRSILQQTQQVTATGDSATVSFDPASLPSPVFFQAVAVQ